MIELVSDENEITRKFQILLDTPISFDFWICPKWQCSASGLVMRVVSWETASKQPTESCNVDHCVSYPELPLDRQ